MEEKNSLSQNIEQKYSLTYTQLQSLNILSMTTDELLSYIEKEQQENPILEVDDKFVTSLNFFKNDNIDDYIFDIPDVKNINIYQYLLEQLPLNKIKEPLFIIVSKVINFLDEDTGYFTNTLSKISHDLHISSYDLKKAVAIIRKLDPAGIGAFNIKDRLILQLKRNKNYNAIIKEIVINHLEDIAKGKIKRIAKSLNIMENDIISYIEKLKLCNPKPMQNFTKYKNNYIIPDAIINYIDNSWDIEIVGPGSHTLLMNNEYVKMSKHSTSNDEKNFFSEKIKKINEINDAIENRKKMLIKIIKYIIKNDESYILGNGIKSKIRQKDLATILNVHPSTISRAVKNKYIKTPIGIFMLKEFFIYNNNKQDGDYNITFSDLEDKMDNKKTFENKVSEICLIASTEKMIKQNIILSKHNDIKIDSFLVPFQEIPVFIHDLFSNGAKIFISRKGTKMKIEEQGVHVVEIGISIADYIPLLKYAKSVNGKIAFFSYRNMKDDIKSMCLLLGIDALYYTYSEIKQCEAIVKRALSDGAVMGIGGAWTEGPAKKFGLKHFIVENSMNELLTAIESAKQMLDLIKKEEKKQEELKIKLERYKLIFDYTHDAIVAVNESGEVEVLNGVAQKIVKYPQHESIGKKIDDVIKNTKLKEIITKKRKEINQIMDINGTLVSTNRIPIIVDGNIKGAVATFQDIKSIQTNEQNIRIKLYKKGLTAKYNFDNIIGNSPEIKNIIEMSKKYAKTNATILIHGESGTGKELFAQSIHNASNRSSGPFVAINCGALPKNILEAELFGYVEGTFTGASKSGKMGLFEMAHNGTIFLDEIGEMPYEIQVQLLRVLQEKEIRRLGSDSVTPINIRIITATNKNLQIEIQNKRFREDLFYRLNVLNIEIPPLRFHKADIFDLAIYLYNQFSQVTSKERGMLLNGMKILKDYLWPGNIRELRNLIERIYIFYSNGESIKFVYDYIETYLKQNVSSNENLYFTTKPSTNTSYYTNEISEKQVIMNSLKKNNFSLSKVARELNISRTTLWRKMKMYCISRD